MVLKQIETERKFGHSSHMFEIDSVYWMFDYNTLIYNIEQEFDRLNLSQMWHSHDHRILTKLGNR